MNNSFEKLVGRIRSEEDEIKALITQRQKIVLVSEETTSNVSQVREVYFLGLIETSLVSE